MQRLIYQNLIAWKHDPGRKPLMLEGARQVGKTYLLKKLGKEEYQHFYYLNFDETPDACTMFEGSISANSILKKLSIYFQTQITPENSLICFDEIQECDNALASLKYLCEDAPEYHVAVAGSLLGIKLQSNKGFPVGKVTILHLYPLSFVEYLHAINKSAWVSVLKELSIHEKVTSIFHKELTEELKIYFFVGGMPEAVAKYIQSSDLEKVRQIHKDILRTYELDFAKHATPAEAAKISLVWDTIPSQLAKENKKFVYSVIRESARAREYESAIQWLVDARLILKSYHISKPGIPLKSYADHQIFKTYFLDIGLLGSMNQLRSKVLLEGDRLFIEYKGALTENYIAQSLTTFLDHPLFYWTSEGKAEVDFIADMHGLPMPIEVKSGFSTKKKSLHVYCDKYSPAISIRTSLMNIAFDGALLNVPLYAISELPRLVSRSPR
jgi:uncharacterized protein